MAEESDGIGILNAGEYSSEYEYDSEIERKRKRRVDLAVKHVGKRPKMVQKTEVTAEYNKEECRKSMYHLLSLDAFSRHKKFVNDYLQYYGGSWSQFKRDSSHDKTDFDVIRENHQFLWDDNDAEVSWGKRVAKKYYDKLFKEYCIADLSRYKDNKVTTLKLLVFEHCGELLKIALRWRIEAEVISGKGQFVCGAKRCEETEGLRSWEVNFGYIEHEQKKNALVKLRLCPECSCKLNYHHRRKEVKRKAKTDPSGTELHEETQAESKSGLVADKAGNVEVQDTVLPSTSSKTAENCAQEDNIWTKSVAVVEEKSRDDEFEDYFEDMFL